MVLDTSAWLQAEAERIMRHVENLKYKIEIPDQKPPFPDPDPATGALLERGNYSAQLTSTQIAEYYMARSGDPDGLPIKAIIGVKRDIAEVYIASAQRLNEEIDALERSVLV